MVVDPGLNQFDINMWQSHRVTPIVATFSDFMSFLDNKISSNNRALGRLTVSSSTSKPYNLILKNNIQISSQLETYLDTELEFIYSSMPYKGVKAKEFYSGMDDGWGGIAQDFDVTRKIAEQALIDAVVDPNIKGMTSLLIKGYAGSGKSVAAKRISWNATNDLNCPSFYLSEGAILRPSLIIELCEVVESRFLLIVDNALANKTEFLRLFNDLSLNDANISILTTSRTNEWNQEGEELEPFISSQFRLDKLTENEVEQIVEKLASNNCLGNFADLEEVKSNFNLTSERQLLVALHEVTSGKSFEEIVLDEYEKISPAEAQVLYMDVCTLNRLNVPIRAGLISRISGISIRDFQKHFLLPLEHLVRTYIDQRSRDYVYVSRHPLIASFVFDHGNVEPQSKAEQLVRVITSMNLNYSADEQAFSELIRGKTLAGIFSDKRLAATIYDAGIKCGASESYIWHQKALFELHHPGADLNAALSAIQNAEKNIEEGRPDRAILHTKATIFRRIANNSSSPLEVEKYRSDAKVILARLSKKVNDSRSLTSLAFLALDELSDRITNMSRCEKDNSSQLNTRVLENLIKKTEDSIYKGLQQFPGDEHLLSVKAKLTSLVKDGDSVQTILENAYHNNPNSEYLAISLSRAKKEAGEIDESIALLREAIAKMPHSKPLHLVLAKMLINVNTDQTAKEAIYHLKRSFSPNDTNYDAQFWYARQQFIFGNRSISDHTFSQLKSVRLSPDERHKIRGTYVNENGEMVLYRGQVISEHVDFVFIRCSELGVEIYAHVANSSPGLNPEQIPVNSEVSFNLGFSMVGPSAINVNKVL